jgi:uncharacterized membrane protein
MRSVRTGLWFVPVVCVLVGVCLSLTTTTLDGAFDYDLIPESWTGGPDVALAILSTTALAMVSLATLVLTITMVVVQLAMGQFSPRIVQTILRDKPSQVAIGVFVATFAHSMLAMRAIRFGEEGQVPGLAIVTAFVLVLVSIAVLVVYVHHVGQALRVASLIELVSSDTRSVIDELYPDVVPGTDRDPDRQTITASASGVISRFDDKRLVAHAREAGCRLELAGALGQFIPAGAPLVRIHGDPDRVDEHEVGAAITLTMERALEHDPAYGFRMLVDIAERSLSESPFQDPTTAVQAIDRLHDCLRQLADRRLGDGRFVDEDGVTRLTVPTMDWDAYVHLAFDEIILAGAGSPQITRRLVAAFEDLATVVPDDRSAVIREQLERLVLLTVEAAPLSQEGSGRFQPDPVGIGPAASR